VMALKDTVKSSSAKTNTIRVGTRESQLARLQTDVVIAELKSNFPEVEFEVHPITTGGDKVLDRPIVELGGRGVFVKELEEALLEDRVDFVVHSLKDLPTDLPDGLTLACVLNREDARDIFVSSKASSFLELAPGSTVATSSRRRAAQLAALRKDLRFVDMRGNIPTRMRKLAEGQCDAMILAAAGLLRLQLADKITQYFDMDVCTPAVGQGALAVECRSGDSKIIDMLKQIEDSATRDEVTAERAFLDILGGGCSVPAGAHAQVHERKEALLFEESGIAGTSFKSGSNLNSGSSFRPGSSNIFLTLTGCVASLDGSEVYRDSITGPREYAAQIGKALAKKLQEAGAEKILDELRASTPNVVSPP
jgi:hydroxymethylbilane synthase